MWNIFEIKKSKPSQLRLALQHDPSPWQWLQFLLCPGLQLTGAVATGGVAASQQIFSAYKLSGLHFYFFSSYCYYIPNSPAYNVYVDHQNMNIFYINSPKQPAASFQSWGRNALSFGSFIHKKQTVDPHAGVLVRVRVVSHWCYGGGGGLQGAWR